MIKGETEQVFHAVVTYDRDRQEWYVSDWSAETGREEGNIWDGKLSEWIFAGNYEPNEKGIIEEEVIEKQFYKKLSEVIDTLKDVLGTPPPPEPEPDLIY